MLNHVVHEWRPGRSRIRPIGVVGAARRIRLAPGQVRRMNKCVCCSAMSSPTAVLQRYGYSRCREEEGGEPPSDPTQSGASERSV